MCDDDDLTGDHPTNNNNKTTLEFVRLIVSRWASNNLTIYDDNAAREI